MPSQIEYPCIRFSTSHDPSSWIIRKRTDFYFSHVEFENEDGWTFGAQLIGGVKWRPPSESNQVNVRRASFRECTSVPPEPDLVVSALDWADKNRRGWGYDVGGVLGIAFGAKDWHTKRTRFCSELIYESFERIGVDLLNNDILRWEVTPRDVAVSPLIYFYPEEKR